MNITVSVTYTLEYHREDFFGNGAIRLVLKDKNEEEYSKTLWINPKYVKTLKSNRDYDGEGFCCYPPYLEDGIVQNYDYIKEECRKLLIKEML